MDKVIQFPSRGFHPDGMWCPRCNRKSTARCYRDQNNAISFMCAKCSWTSPPASWELLPETHFSICPWCHGGPGRLDIEFKPKKCFLCHNRRWVRL